MQRVKPNQRTGYAARRLALRSRSRAGPQPSRPATTPSETLYVVRVRNGGGTWAAYITTLREATGLSRSELARRLGVDPTTVWRWETGRQKPESPTVPKALAELFHLDLDEALAAAGLRPAEPGKEPPRREPPLDPDLITIARALADPNVPAEQKATIRATLEYLANLPPRVPRRRRREAS